MFPIKLICCILIFSLSVHYPHRVSSNTVDSLVNGVWRGIRPTSRPVHDFDLSGVEAAVSNCLNIRPYFSKGAFWKCFRSLMWELSIKQERSTTEAPTSPKMSGNSDNPLSAHVLDTTVGRPGPGILVTLSKEENGQWRKISEQLTNKDGRVGKLISKADFTASKYKLNFNPLSYFESRGQKTFYPYIDVVFQVERPEEHYHVPILLNAYGYSTYRGS